MKNIISHLFELFSQFLENQGFLASVSNDNEIQVTYKFTGVLLNCYMTRHPPNMLCNCLQQNMFLMYQSILIFSFNPYKNVIHY